MRHQALIIGGGFFGCALALHLRRRGYTDIAVIEREPDLLTRASYRNQARVHNGYHYPRSFVTAVRSRINLPRFCRDYGFAVVKDFVSLYAVAAARSNVIPRQYERFMRDIGATYETAGSGYRSLFDPNLIAGVYVTQEYAFDASRLRTHFHREMAAAGIKVRLNTTAEHIADAAAGVFITVNDGRGAQAIEADVVFNCGYARLNYNVTQTTPLTALKHELAEIALVEAPTELRAVAVTVMDGPFFSCFPFPAEGCHSLTHVRYTPHGSLLDNGAGCNPMQAFEAYPQRSHVHHMIADAARFVPCMRFARWRKSLFDVKTVLARSEADDGRPVLLRRETASSRVFSILGAKIDNIYDVLTRLDEVLDERVGSLATHAEHVLA